MAHDYTALDRAIINRVAKGCVGFSALCGAVLKHSESLAANDKAPAWRIVDRRLQALRKAGRICYQRKPEGWVLHEAAANAKLMAAAPVLLDYYRASRNLQMTLGHPDATAQDEHEDKWMLANAAAQAAIKAERERCALIADKQARKVNSSWIAQEIAYDIRRGIEA